MKTILVKKANEIANGAFYAFPESRLGFMCAAFAHLIWAALALSSTAKQELNLQPAGWQLGEVGFWLRQAAE